jgi:hypothetical protein
MWGKAIVKCNCISADHYRVVCITVSGHRLTLCQKRGLGWSMSSSHVFTYISLTSCAPDARR